jgi:large subunit ribosomal protein L6
MSNYIGNKTIFLSSQMSLKKYKNFLIMKGAYGILKIKITIPLYITYKNLALFFKFLKINKNDFKFKSMWGTYRMLVANNLTGLFKLHFCKLKFIGVGYKAILKKSNLILRLGFSHKIFCTIPKNLIIKKIKKRPPIFLLKSFDFEVIQKISNQIRIFKKPEPYKGKGIIFFNEIIKRKQGKKSKN